MPGASSASHGEAESAASCLDCCHCMACMLSSMPCATLSMLTYYRTSRSLHFPFWAVSSCSLSGAQPEIWSVSWKPPVHRIAFRLFVAFPFNQRPSSSAPPEGEGAPGSSGPVHSGRHTARDMVGQWRVRLAVPEPGCEATCTRSSYVVSATLGCFTFPLIQVAGSSMRLALFSMNLQ